MQHCCVISDCTSAEECCCSYCWPDEPVTAWADLAARHGQETEPGDVTVQGQVDEELPLAMKFARLNEQIKRMRKKILNQREAIKQKDRQIDGLKAGNARSVEVLEQALLVPELQAQVRDLAGRLECALGDRDELGRMHTAMTESRDCWVHTHKVATQMYAKELARMAGLVLGRVE